MEEIAEITRELDALERVQRELAAIASRTDEARKHDLILLRKKLADQIAATGRLADPFFAEAESEIARDYRAKFSRMRSAAAMHQANWPAVRLGEAVEEYRSSALQVREANRDFVAWMREALSKMELS